MPAIVHINLLGVRIEIDNGIANCKDKRVEDVVNVMLERIPSIPDQENFDLYAADRVADWLGGEVLRNKLRD